MLTAALYQCGDISTSSSMTMNISLSLHCQARRQADMIPLLVFSLTNIFRPWLNLKFLAMFSTNSP